MSGRRHTESYTRRDFLVAAAGSVAAGIAAVALPRRARGQDSQQPSGQDGQGNAQGNGQGPRTTMSGPMSESAYRPVVLPPKPGAKPSMSDGQRDALEHQLHCQCGCTLDVFTCRTTDFTCPVSPPMHSDIVALVLGGYSAGEILDAFRKTYGERVLMSPVREGFNWAGYVAPFVALGGATIAVAVFIRRWREVPAASGGSAVPTAPGDASGATPDEMARLEAAIRDDER
ncbi:MAG: cytochrome c-type biogenesis protein CcmH [Gemmatimonadales bacterium]